jgi:tetratricopeptide (TPR) repeat protein
VLLTEMGRAEEAYAAALEAHGRQPHVPVILLAQAYVLRYAGFLDQSSRALERALALDPLVLLEWREPPLTLLYQGRFQEFLKYVAAETGSYELFHRGWAELLRGNRAAALHAVESAFARNPADLFGRYGSALAAWLSGDPETGLVIVRGIVQQRDTLRTPDGEMTYREAQLLAAFGDEPSAVVRLARAVEQGFFCPSCLEAGPFLSALRGAAGFDAVLSRASSRHHEFGTRFAFDDLTADPTPPSRRD